MTADEFKAARAELGLSQDGLSKILGCTVAAIYRWEHGQRPVSGLAAAFLRHLLKEQKP